jgi:putative ABC transport system permease protein
MSWRRTFSKIRFLFLRRPDDLAEEIRTHLAMEEAENVAAGMGNHEARDQAHLRFGNVTLAEEKSRDMWSWTAIETLRTDVAYGLRQLRRNPAFAVIAILTLALGIGANTAIFSVVNAVLLQSLPFSDPDRLVEARETEQAPGTYPVNPADYLDWQAQNRTLEATTVFSWTGNRSMAGPNEPAAAAVTEVQANFFKLLGIAPVVGRSFATVRTSRAETASRCSVTASGSSTLKEKRRDRQNRRARCGEVHHYRRNAAALSFPKHNGRLGAV